MDPKLKPAAPPEHAEHNVFRLDAAAWHAFQARLKRPAKAKPNLARLLATKSVLE